MAEMFLSASDIAISDAAVRALVGFVIVLAVLALLVGIFYLSGFLFRTKFLSKDKLFSFGKKNKDKSLPKDGGEPVSADMEDEETVAAITAAITVMLSEDGDAAPEFVIRRIARKK